MGVLQKARTIVWGEVPTEPREAKLLRKIDWFVLSFACLLYWINYVDRLNISNAYVSGMKQDLNMKGNELNYINTAFTVGYTVFLLPNNLILLKVRPRYWLTFCAFAWGLLTLGIYKTTNYKQIIVIRFFQAGFEASTFTGVHLILGSWYKEDELAKRTAIFTSSGLIGNIFSSVMQSAIYTNLHDVGGLAGWRWLFIIDFIVTVPIAIYGFLLFPDTPATCKAFYFSEEEIALARERVKLETPDGHEIITKLDWTLVKRVVGNWHWWVFSLLFALGGENESFPINSVFALWLSAFGYTVPQRNHYPMGVYAVGILATFTCAFYIDGTGARYHWRAVVGICVCVFVSAVVFLTDSHNAGAAFFSQYLSGVSYAAQTTFFAWANVVCKNDLQERAVVLASMNMFSNAVNAWWSILFFGASTAPKFTKGCYALIATSIATAIVACVARYLQIEEAKKITIFADKADEEGSVESSDGLPRKVDAEVKVLSATESP